jgi:endoglucanase Acf2
VRVFFARVVISVLFVCDYAEHVLMYARDFANPSPQDPYFPTWRHKDWLDLYHIRQCDYLSQEYY